MQFSRIVAFFLAFFAFTFVATAKPVEKRGESDITDPLNSIVTELKDVLGECPIPL